MQKWKLSKLRNIHKKEKNEMTTTTVHRATWAAMAVATLFAFLFGMVPQMPAAQQLTKKQVNALIATAKTPEDHMKLAAYYRDKAEQAKAEAAEHEKMLAAYNQNPSTHLPAKAAGGPTEHCRTLIRLFNEEQKEDLALADQHEQMAKDASK